MAPVPRGVGASLSVEMLEAIQRKAKEWGAPGEDRTIAEVHTALLVLTAEVHATVIAYIASRTGYPQQPGKPAKVPTRDELMAHRGDVTAYLWQQASQVAQNVVEGMFSQGVINPLGAAIAGAKHFVALNDIPKGAANDRGAAVQELADVDRRAELATADPAGFDAVAESARPDDDAGVPPPAGERHGADAGAPTDNVGTGGADELATADPVARGADRPSPTVG
jgi:hypothetical protein